MKKYRTHREQVIKMFQSAFKLVTLKCIKDKLSKHNIYVLSLIKFYGNRNILVYKVIGAVIYTIIDEYICLDYLDLLQEKLSKHDNNFKDTKFDYFTVLGIPDILINIISCHGFVKSSISTVILTYHNALVPYYLSKGFFVVETEVGGVDNIPIIVKTNQCYSFK